MRCRLRAGLSPNEVCLHSVFAYARCAFSGKPTTPEAPIVTDVRGSSLVGRRPTGSGSMTARFSLPTNENPTSEIVTAKVLRLVTSIDGNAPGINSLQFDRSAPFSPATVSLGTTSKRTRCCKSPCTKFQRPNAQPMMPDTAPTIAVADVSVSIVASWTSFGAGCANYTGPFQTISSVAGSQCTGLWRRYEAIAIWHAMAALKPVSKGQLGVLRLRTQSKKFCMWRSVKSL